MLPSKVLFHTSRLCGLLVHAAARVVQDKLEDSKEEVADVLRSGELTWHFFLANFTFLACLLSPFDLTESIASRVDVASTEIKERLAHPCWRARIRDSCPTDLGVAQN